MNRQTILIASSIAFALVALAIPAGDAAAQGAKALVGSWTIVKSGSYGDNPRGLLIFSASGHYQLSIQRASLPKFASNNRTKGTAAENAGVVTGSINHFGTYTVDEKAKTLTFKIQGSTFPNWDGASQVRPFTIKDGLLTYKVAASSGTGKPGEVTWRKVK